LLLRLPELKADLGPVATSLQGLAASAQAIEAWQALVAEEILPEDEDAGF